MIRMSEEIYFSIDVETAGPIPAEFSMLSLGASLVNQPEHFYYAELKPINENFVPEALAVSKFEMSVLKIEGEEPSAAIKKFKNWVEITAGASKPIFVGFNAGFDWSFVNWYFHKFTGGNPFGFAPLDIKSYYMGAFGCLWSETTSSRLSPEIQPTTKATHNALDDARAQAEIFSNLLAKETTRKKR